MAPLLTLLPLLPAVFAAAVPRPAQDIKPRLDSFTSLPPTTSYSESITSLQSAIPTGEAGTTGSVHVSLETGRVSAAPFPTETPSEVGSIAPAPTDFKVADVSPTVKVANNIFVPMASASPPVRSRSDHPVPKLGIKNQNGPVSTNKFYANFFLGAQGFGTWTHPYSLTWSKGNGNAGSWGLAVTHIEQSQFSFAAGNPAEYFIAPIGIHSVILSAAELGSSTSLTTDTLQAFSANVNLAPSSGASPVVSFPLVQGMGFVTAVYNGATPYVQSNVFFRTLSYVGPLDGGRTYKYRTVLEDGTNWLIYITPTGSVGDVPLTLEKNTLISGPSTFKGIIQVAKNPAGTDGEKSYDASAGAYAQSATISASVSGSSGSYTLTYQKGGLSEKTLLMFALPHHVSSLDSTTSGAKTSIQLQTTTKGKATAFLSDRLTMVESDLPTSMDFSPWSTFGGPVTGGGLSETITSTINAVAADELTQNIAAQSILNSMYYSGKGLAKFAQIVYTLHDLTNNVKLAQSGLAVLEDVFNVFVNNTQPYPLVYDSVWGGVVSEASYTTGDSGMDFGNSYYNDHHFHYGYFVYTAAVMAYLDANWLSKGNNKAWVDMLVRDYANPSSEDPYFPFARSFDWYHGHSWAKGLFESADGKDQESTSEDVAATYALKMWGKITGDANMEARATLQLAIQKRSMSNYFLYESTNTVEPSNFIGNKVSGILFENKIHHTTYFGANTEYIQGIHMIPLTPASAYTRSPTFVKEEWDTYFNAGRVNNVSGGWRGILMANYALSNPTAAYNFFATGATTGVAKRGEKEEMVDFSVAKRALERRAFDASWLDGGASRTWYLALAAGLEMGKQ